MTELLFARTACETQGHLFAEWMTAPTATAVADDDTKRRPGETALDYRIRRQYRDVSATPPLFPPCQASPLRGR